MVFKKLISPVQKILMKKGVCPGCGRPLTKAGKKEDLKKGQERITCKCRRVFIFNKATQEYRRALLDEI